MTRHGFLVLTFLAVNVFSLPVLVCASGPNDDDVGVGGKPSTTAATPAPASEPTAPTGFHPPTWSMGLNIGGWGLPGWDNLFSLGPYVSFDLTVGAYPVFTFLLPLGEFFISDDLTITPAFYFWFGGRSDQPKGPNRHGIFLAGAYAPYPYPAAGGGLGYVYQRYKDRKHLYTVQVGLSYFDLLPQGRAAILGYDDESLHFGFFGFMLYWRFSWTWPVVK